MLNQIVIPENDPVAVSEKRALIDQSLEENKDRPGGLMVILNEVQSKLGFISEPMQIYIANRLRIPVSTVHGVVSFYSFFTTTARGRHTIKFCMGTACYVGGTAPDHRKSQAGPWALSPDKRPKMARSPWKSAAASAPAARRR